MGRGNRCPIGAGIREHQDHARQACVALLERESAHERLCVYQPCLQLEADAQVAEVHDGVDGALVARYRDRHLRPPLQRRQLCLEPGQQPDVGAVSYRIGAGIEAHNEVQSHHCRQDGELVERRGSCGALRPAHTGLRDDRPMRDRFLAQAGATPGVPKRMAQLQAEPCGTSPTSLTWILAGCHVPRMPVSRCRRLIRALPIHPGAGATGEPASARPEWRSAGRPVTPRLGRPPAGAATGLGSRSARYSGRTSTQVNSAGAPTAGVSRRRSVRT